MTRQKAADLLDRAATHLTKHGLAQYGYIDDLGSGKPWDEACACAAGALGIVYVLDRPKEEQIRRVAVRYAASIVLDRLGDSRAPDLDIAGVALATAIEPRSIEAFITITGFSDRLVDTYGTWLGATHMAARMRYAARCLREMPVMSPVQWIPPYVATDGYSLSLGGAL